jgi:hypothetical protein
MDYKKIYAIKKANEERILKVCPNCPNTSGIYFLLRDDDGFKYAYIGQAVKLRERLASHLSGYQHIDLSIKKHGLWSKENQTGYKLHFLEYPENLLDKMQAAGIDVDALDALALAEEAGSAKAVNIVLMGRLAKYFDISTEDWMAAIEASVPAKFLDLNKKAFNLGLNS